MKTNKKFCFTILSLILLLISNPCIISAQTYDDLLREAEIKFEAKDYVSAAQLNEKAFEVADEKDKAENLFYETQCWALSGNKPKAFQCLERAIDYGWSDLERTKKAQAFATLKNESQWEILMLKFTKVHSQKNTTYFWGMFLGILFILFFYNIFLYFSLRDIAFLFFSLSIFFIAQIEITRTSEFGIYAANIFVWSKYIHMRTADLVCLFMVFHLLFGKNFLNLKTIAPRLNIINQVLIIFFILYFLILLVAGDSVFAGRFIILPAFLIGYLFTFIAGIICWKNGYRPARFFVIANIASAVGFFMTAVNFMGIINYDFQISVFHADNLGSIAFCGLMSFALGDKINIHKKEKEEAQEKALEVLEEKVQERTEEVIKQKHVIEEKHKEITDSINYAERIQRSFIATKEILDENLNDYFVLFKSKDVVSGDFYWASKLNNGNFALATADSTGHGVPGAIMSLLNITSLEKAIETLNNPSDILNSTRKTIIERLKKDGSAEGGKDGMDASLTVYDFKNKKLIIAAANNPVWIVKGKETIEIKPDKMPVGKHDKDTVSFTQQEVDLQTGDVIYTLTDGFPDQFGGEKGKKFMSKNLRELLVANANLPMQKQKELLEQTFTNWVGNLEQIDDVTLIGVRV